MLTYCPHCKTAFRVNEAHLQARRGKVRCGRCNGVFNALENLVATPPSSNQVRKPVPVRPRVLVKPSTVNPAITVKTSSTVAASDKTSKPNTAAALKTAQTQPVAATSPAASERHSNTVTKPAEQPAARQASTTKPAEPSPARNLSAVEKLLSEKTAAKSASTGETSARSTQASAAKASAAKAPAATHGIDVTKSSSAKTTRSKSSTKTSRQDKTRSSSQKHDHLKNVRRPASGNWLRPRSQTNETSASESSTIPPLLDPNMDSYFSIVPADEITVTFNDTITFPPLRPTPVRPPGSSSPTSQWIEAPVRNRKKASISDRLTIYGIILCTILLALQWGLYNRNNLALSYPSLKPVLHVLCLPLGCIIPPMHNESLLDTVSELSVDPNNPSLSRLDVTLRNRAHEAQAWPYFELTLKDSYGKTVARKVIQPENYLSPPSKALFGPRETLDIALWLEIHDLNQVGYVLETFYP